MDLYSDMLACDSLGERSGGDEVFDFFEGGKAPFWELLRKPWSLAEREGS